MDGLIRRFDSLVGDKRNWTIQEMVSLKITAVIPVYNEEELVDEFSTRLVVSLASLTSDYEVIFIVEGDDDTLSKLNQLSERNPRVRTEYSAKRLGLGRAIKKGLGLVSTDTDLVLIMDADLNHQPEEIQRLLAASDHADIVVGCRSRFRGLVKELPLFKRMISSGTNWVLRKTFGVPSSDITSGFRLYSAKAIQSVRGELTGKNFEVTPEILIRAKKKGFSIVEVPITFTPRPRGKSKLSFFKSGIGYVVLLLRLGF